jgi:hypothetical protein
MSDGELTRLEVLRDLDQKQLTTEAAAQLLGSGVVPAVEGIPERGRGGPDLEATR